MPTRAEPAVHRSRGAGVDVYTTIRTEILTGEIPPSAKLNIDALARRLDVSQTPVREALQRLEGDNLVDYTPGRGYATTALLSLTELRALFEFRLLVEPWAASAAAADRLANPAEALDQELKQLKTAMGVAGEHRQSLVMHDARFHDTILAAAGNPVLRHAFAQTHCHLHTFRLYSADVDGEITAAEHATVSEAIRACDPKAAGQAMTQHIRSSFDRFRLAFDDYSAELPVVLGTGPRIVR